MHHHCRSFEEREVALMHLRSHVERCLQDVWNTHDLVVDDDGDYPFRRGTAVGWVSVRRALPLRVSVFAHAAYELRRSALLLEEINDLNSAARWAKIALDDGVVLVGVDLPDSAVNRISLADAIDAVGTLADEVGPVLAAVFGGTTPIPLNAVDQAWAADETTDETTDEQAS